LFAYAPSRRKIYKKEGANMGREIDYGIVKIIKGKYKYEVRF
jgi:hypothetical protein